MNKKFIVVFAIVGIIVVPSIINWIGNTCTIKSNANFGDWLGFWGSYLGGFVTLLGVYLGFFIDNKKDRRQSLIGNMKHLESTLLILREIRRNIQFNIVTPSKIEKSYTELSAALKDMPTLHYDFYIELKRIEQLAFLAYLSLDVIEPYQTLAKYSSEEKLEDNLREIQNMRDRSNEFLGVLEESINSFESHILRHIHKN